MITIVGPCRNGALVPKPPGPHKPKPQRFYNWPAGLKDGQPPVGVDFEREVPDDQYHRRLIHRGSVELKKAVPADPAPKPKKGEK